MTHKLTQADAEVMLLKVIKELIDSIVNFEVFSLIGEEPAGEVRFFSLTHQKYFNLVLVDFLSTTDKDAPIQPTTYLNGLRTIIDRPQFNVDNSVLPLRTSATEFIAWLEDEIEVPTWFPSINLHATLKVQRLDFLKITGNICKHSFLRLFQIANKVRTLLRKTGNTITTEEAVLALGDFYERFHTDILNYHSSTIAEMLNNIRWGIYEYLQPERRRSIVIDSENATRYRYTYPPSITTSFSKDCYRGLMDDVQSRPYMRKFTVTRFLKLRY